MNRFGELGYSDRSSLIREAIDRYRGEVEQNRLNESAILYAEVYAEDDCLRQLTRQSLEGWPE